LKLERSEEVDNQYFTKEGLEKLKAELEERLSVTRPEIATRLKEAKEEGDISENAAFDSAKESQSVNEGRIEEIKATLDKAVIFEGGKSGGVVQVGSSLKVESKNGEQSFVIVGSAESDPANGFISNESPLGKAFLGHKKGDKINIETPRGTVEYKVKDIK
jgi:transcription elongation factor GreA